MNTQPAEIVLSVKDLTVAFALERQQFTAVDQVSFQLCAGEMVGLVGESGCGKTTAGAALLGLVPRPAGQVTVGHLQLENRDLAALDENAWRHIRGHHISMIFQEPLTALDPVFSIGSQLHEVIRRHQRCSRSSARRAAADMLQTVGFTDGERIQRCYPHELSGGMRQRVMIAMAMCCSPRVLVADEPTTALDVTTQAQILQQIRELARNSGTAVLLITHDLGVVAQACDRALVMYCGRIVEEGPVASLFSYPRHPYTAGLVAAMPVLSQGAVQRVETIPGSVPPLQQHVPGCRFSNRCARAQALCSEQVPPLLATDSMGQSAGSATGGHRCACHYPLHLGDSELAR